MLPVSRTGYLLLLVISAIVCQLLLFYSSSYWVRWETVIGEVVETVGSEKDMYEEIVDSEKDGNETVGSERYVYDELRIRLGEHVESIKEDPELRLVMKSQIEQLGENDGLSAWRQQEARDLTQTVQSAITRLQTPASCSQARKLVCHLSYAKCGFGCLIHHAAYCFVTALATGRVLVISDQPWYYSDIAIKRLFRPLSTACTSYTGPTKKVWQVDPSDPTPTLEFLPSEWRRLASNKQPYNSPAIHTSLADRIFRLTAEPDAWWLGQFVGYLLRHNHTVRNILHKAEERIDFSSPVVGIHVRRTDKIGTFGGGFASSQLFEIEEYMEKVEMWFRRYEMSHNRTKRQIYLATDEPQVLEECHSKYPEYTIYDNIKIAKSAAQHQFSRDSEESLLGVIQDIHMLSLTNYVVCTHTSNICRLVYELLHYKHGQASNMLHSLDIPWGYQFVRKNVNFQALVDQPSLRMRRGDSLLSYNVRGNYYTQRGDTTLIQAKNMRTGEKHLYPVYMVKQLPTLFNFSSFL